MLESKKPKERVGFQSGFSTIDQIWKVNQNMEKMNVMVLALTRSLEGKLRCAKREMERPLLGITIMYKKNSNG